MKITMTSLRAILVFTFLVGAIYPLSVTVMAQILWPDRAGGSIQERDGRPVGSVWIAQKFSQPRYFWPRPSAIQYDAASSGGSNASVTSGDLAHAVREREAAGAVAEMRYASSSGLDPHVSPEASRAQISRVAKARGLGPQQTKDLETMVEQSVEARQFGFLGAPRVNVLRLNLALDERFGR